MSVLEPPSKTTTSASAAPQGKLEKAPLPPPLALGVPVLVRRWSAERSPPPGLARSSIEAMAANASMPGRTLSSSPTTWREQRYSDIVTP